MEYLIALLCGLFLAIGITQETRSQEMKTMTTTLSRNATLLVVTLLAIIGSIYGVAHQIPVLAWLSGGALGLATGINVADVATKRGLTA